MFRKQTHIDQLLAKMVEDGSQRLIMAKGLELFTYSVDDACTLASVLSWIDMKVAVAYGVPDRVCGMFGRPESHLAGLALATTMLTKYFETRELPERLELFGIMSSLEKPGLENAGIKERCGFLSAVHYLKCAPVVRRRLTTFFGQTIHLIDDSIEAEEWKTVLRNFMYAEGSDLMACVRMTLEAVQRSARTNMIETRQNLFVLLLESVKRCEKADDVLDHVIGALELSSDESLCTTAKCIAHALKVANVGKVVCERVVSLFTNIAVTRTFTIPSGVDAAVQVARVLCYGSHMIPLSSEALARFGEFAGYCSHCHKVPRVLIQIYRIGIDTFLCDHQGCVTHIIRFATSRNVVLMKCARELITGAIRVIDQETMRGNAPAVHAVDRLFSARPRNASGYDWNFMPIMVPIVEYMASVKGMDDKEMQAMFEIVSDLARRCKEDTTKHRVYELCVSIHQSLTEDTFPVFVQAVPLLCGVKSIKLWIDAVNMRITTNPRLLFDIWQMDMTGAEENIPELSTLISLLLSKSNQRPGVLSTYRDADLLRIQSGVIIGAAVYPHLQEDMQNLVASTGFDALGEAVLSPEGIERFLALADSAFREPETAEALTRSFQAVASLAGHNMRRIDTDTVRKICSILCRFHHKHTRGLSIDEIKALTAVFNRSASRSLEEFTVPYTEMLMKGTPPDTIYGLLHKAVKGGVFTSNI